MLGRLLDIICAVYKHVYCIYIYIYIRLHYVDGRLQMATIIYIPVSYLLNNFVHIKYNVQIINCLSTNGIDLQGVPENMRLGRRLGGLLIDILIRMKGPSIQTNMRKICVILTEFYSNISARPSLFSRAHILSMSHVFWDSLYITCNLKLLSLKFYLVLHLNAYLYLIHELILIIVLHLIHNK